MKTKITQNEKLQLLGLVTLGQQHYKVTDLVRDAITEIVENDDTLLHEAVWDYDRNFDEALKQMNIEVTDAAS